MLRHKIVRDAALLNGANLIGQCAAIVQRLLVMRFIDPSLYGIWLAAAIVQTYAGYAHFGLEHGMGVRLPYYIGKGDESRPVQIAQTAYGTWTLLALLTAAGVSVYALLFAHGALQISLLAIAAMIVFEQQIQYAVRWHSSTTQNFALISKLAVARTLLLFVFAVPAAWAFGIYGLIGGTLASTAVTVLLWYRAGSFPRRPRISREVTVELLTIGFPILLVVLIGGLIDTIDRTVIVLMLGASTLGYYGVTTLGGSSMYGLLAQAGSAMSPHMAVEFGRSGDDPSSLERYLVRPTLVFATVAAVLSIGLIFVIPPLVKLVLPRYVAGLPAFHAYVPGFFFLATIITANNIVNLILIARKRQRLFIYAQCVAVAAEIVLAVAAIRTGFGITGVAIASTTAYAIYALSTVTMAAWFVFDDAGRVTAFVIDVLKPLLYTSVTAALIIWITRPLHLNVISEAVLRGVLFAAASLPLLFWLQSRTEVITSLAGAIRPWVSQPQSK